MTVYAHINTVPNGSTGGIMMKEHRELLAAGEDSYAFWGRGRAGEGDRELRFATDAEVRLYDRLFLVENPSDEEGVGDFSENRNPDSVEVISDCKIEKTLDIGEKGKTFQFMRQGYFCVDDDSTPEHPVFNRTVALKDSWAKKK